MKKLFTSIFIIILLGANLCQSENINYDTYMQELIDLAYVRG